MPRIIGPILALLGIFIVFGLVAGAAYTAGLGAAGVVVAPAGTAVAPVVAYPWYGLPFLGFGQFLVFLLVVFLLVGLARLAFGGGRRGRPGWGSGHGYGPAGSHGGWGGWGADERHPDGDPREAWIRGRLDDWHRSAHAADPTSAAGSAPGASGDPTAGADPSRPSDPPIAG
jgi:hypothetical protein